jgi:hypothetical protein
LEWDAPFHRVAYWTKFGHPEGYFSRVGDSRDMATLWWIDPQKEAELRRALGDDSITMPVGATEDRYWQEYESRAEAAATAQ